METGALIVSLLSWTVKNPTEERVNWNKNEGLKATIAQILRTPPVG